MNNIMFKLRSCNKIEKNESGIDMYEYAWTRQIVLNAFGSNNKIFAYQFNKFQFVELNNKTLKCNGIYNPVARFLFVKEILNETNNA